MSSFVYLLQHKAEPRFKIGKANDVIARVRQLGHRHFSFDRSKALEVDSEQASQNVERLLHRLFASFRLDPAATQDARFPGLRRGQDGSTEWFNMACWDRLTRFLADNHDLLLFKEVSVNALRAMAQTLLAESDAAIRARQTSAYQRALAQQRLETVYRAEREKLRQQLGQSRVKIHGGCRFTAAVADQGQMYLVGEAPRNRSTLIVRQLDAFVAQLSAVVGEVKLKGENRRSTDAKGNLHFAIALPGEPDEGSSRQAWQRGWTEELNALLWDDTSGIAGFGTPLRLAEMVTAARVFSKAKCATNPARV
ncbi:GIY-YIG nuclease family protein [Burkholderia cenocepacia]|uniref:GIY-YIG nuclease family protein n=1 Tax=Burkholderia cenocepacia TaxID=95486 RepID=UPI0007618FA3|nr:GIY-YIG nuclease family protein [Burkholderia cenocepacia]KWU19020.1 hypothetical protein AS149_12285 [Burkholderia cenocepacia]